MYEYTNPRKVDWLTKVKCTNKCANYHTCTDAQISISQLLTTTQMPKAKCQNCIMLTTKWMPTCNVQTPNANARHAIDEQTSLWQWRVSFDVPRKPKKAYLWSFFEKSGLGWMWTCEHLSIWVCCEFIWAFGSVHLSIGLLVRMYFARSLFSFSFSLTFVSRLLQECNHDNIARLREIVCSRPEVTTDSDADEDDNDDPFHSQSSSSHSNANSGNANGNASTNASSSGGRNHNNKVLFPMLHMVFDYMAFDLTALIELTRAKVLPPMGIPTVLCYSQQLLKVCVCVKWDGRIVSTIVRVPNAQMLSWSNAQMLKSSAGQMLKCSNAQLVECSNAKFTSACCDEYCWIVCHCFWCVFVSVFVFNPCTVGLAIPSRPSDHSQGHQV